MRIPLSWLKTFIDVSDIELLAHELVAIGIEVEKVWEERPSFSGVVVGVVEEVSKHPNAEKLTLARVFDGKESFSVVCGAPNCREGMRVAFAKIGARLSEGEGKGFFEIKKATLRGVDSYGMLCAEDELGIGSSHDGIVELDQTFLPGEDLAGKLSDTILEVAITPNLGHCLSIEGIARELSAKMEKPYRVPFSLPELIQRRDGWSVSLIAKEECPSYGAAVIEGSFERETPLEMKLHLQRAGIRPVSLLVDIANWVMLSIGQPLHTFDAASFSDKNIVVDVAKGEESLFHLLDGKRIQVAPQTLLIGNGKEVCAVAGVMGGESSSVKSGTTKIVVESAYFDPKAIRRAGKALMLQSEALRRFERGVDPVGFKRGLELFWWCLSRLVPEAQLQAVIFEGREKVPCRELACRLSRTEAVLGRPILREEMEQVFLRLGYPCSWKDADTLLVSVPPYRNDVAEEVDLIEDIAKLTGFSPTQSTEGAKIFVTSMHDHPLFVCEQKTRQILVDLGLQEFVTCDLISPMLVNLVADQPVPRHAIISVMNPMSLDQSILRPSLFPGLVDSLRRNIFYGQKSIAAFEVGIAHFRSEGKFVERLVAGVILSGNKAPHHFDESERGFDFFDLKGIMESFCGKFGVENISVATSAIRLFHDGRQAIILCGGHQVGMLGEIHPTQLDLLGISQRVYFMELDVQDLFARLEVVGAVKTPAVYPAMERDWTVTLPESLPYQEFIATVKKHISSLVEDVQLMSIFKHERIGEDKKNITVRYIFRHAERTLEQKEVDDAFSHMVHSVSRALGVSL